MSQYCPFCRRDPFHYVDVGVGFVPAAIVCCDAGVDLYSGRGPARKILALRQSYSPRKKARAKRLMAEFYGEQEN